MIPFIILAFFILHAGRAYTACYWPDGSAAGPGYSPCNPSGTSMCCAFGNGDVCTAEGLCRYQDASGTVSWWRDSCTDQTWTSPGCAQLCLCTEILHPVPVSKESSLLNLTGALNPHLNQCGDGSWCCTPCCPPAFPASANLTCCQSSQGAKLLPTSVSASSSSSPTASTSSSSPASTSSSSPASTSSSPLAASSPASTNQGASNDVLHVGLGVGLGLGIPLAAAVICLAIFAWKRRHMPSQQMVPPQKAYGSQQNNQSASWQMHHAGLPAAVGSPERAELDYGSRQNNQSASWQMHRAELPEAVGSPERAELYSGP